MSVDYYDVTLRAQGDLLQFLTRKGRVWWLLALPGNRKRTREKRWRRWVGAMTRNKLLYNRWELI